MGNGTTALRPVREIRAEAQTVEQTDHVEVTREFCYDPKGLWKACGRRDLGTVTTNFVSSAIFVPKLVKENAVQHERIEINPDVMYGKPVIRGTRVPVELVFRKLGAGIPAETILADHPRLTLDDIHAARAFAAAYLADVDGSQRS